jgi:hypothetical protein
MRRRFLTLSILPRNGTVKCMKVDAPMYVFSVGKQRGQSWDGVQSPAGDYFLVRKSRPDNSLGYTLSSSRANV